MKCNICNGTEFVDMNTRKQARCAKCGAYERTRVIKLLLDKFALVRPGAKVLHLAPEGGLARHIRSIVGRGYDPRDLDTARYGHVGVTRFDLVREVQTLPDDTYDLVLHSHVMEHLDCDVTAVLFHLHRALSPRGVHVFSVPILRGHYEASLAPLSPQERTRRFGQFDHVRRWGTEDISRTLGMLFELPSSYDLESTFSALELDQANIPPEARRGFSGHSVFVVRKSDIKLRSSRAQFH